MSRKNKIASNITTSSSLNNWGSTTTTTINSIPWQNVNLNGTGYYSFDTTDTNVIEFFEFICEIIGIDMTYSKFKGLSKEERKQFLRDSKIKDILK